MATAVECGSLRCQRDSYAQSLSTVVLSCVQTSGEDAKLGKYAVQLQDTVLFPEGGGQPDDRGSVGGVQVKRVVRRRASALHFLEQELEEGSPVCVELDWQRRFDHMQQHSGQHLITAVIDKEFGYKTTSWNLAVGRDNRCFIELATKSLSAEQMARAEQTCNQLIREAVPMVPHWYTPGSPEMEQARSRGLPEDFEGSSVRVVEIEGLDFNMCCGTHVASLSHLQCVKLLYSESKKGCTLLYYLVGGRVLDYVQKALNTERALTKMLSVGLDDHRDAVEKIQHSSKAAAKQVRAQLREIAQLVAFRHLHSDPVDPVACVHRDDGDVEFMNVVANQLTPKDVFVMATVGGDRGCGQFLLAGKDEDVATLGPLVAKCLEAKGGGRKGRYQGKAQKLEKRSEAETLIREHFSKT